MSTQIKLVQSPYEDALVVAEGILIKLHTPSSGISVTIQIAPNVQNYQEGERLPIIEIGKTMSSTKTEDTKTLTLDLDKNKKKIVNIENHDYEIKLLNIGKENILGESFKYFEFKVSKIQ